ncbi:MurR/RpiR family transcriptional regulator [Aliibacillus thermotolerans]|uniref:MurR/RpiR family transcriptional regulator n=1 Tax=Aliibacillus thermotolerans TaxID=1834418 RepID=A0ABW0U5J4_9BACI|nr:MurR/RpiR family transcriptional regulator [Aliibacillus thermotolerans]MDA3130515.1 SIS domain-containing protein [Aliibacillus thermotolerans]
MKTNLKEKLIEIQYNLPRQQQKLCKYIIENIDDVSTMTINELSKNSKVGTTTILRFIEKVGYKKYPDFKKDLIKQLFHERKNTWWHLQKSLEEIDEAMNSLVKVGNSSIQDIETMLRRLDTKEYEKFIDLLLHSNKVYFLGLRTSKSIALYFDMMLRGILDSVVQLSWSPDFLYDESLNFGKNDTIVVIALSPYAKQTIDFIKYCRNKKNVSVALITDIETCPIIQHSDAHLIVGHSKNRYSIIPTIALIEALIIDLGKKQPESIPKISELNKMHRENNLTTI